MDVREIGPEEQRAAVVPMMLRELTHLVPPEATLFFDDATSLERTALGVDGDDGLAGAPRLRDGRDPRPPRPARPRSSAPCTRVRTATSATPASTRPSAAGASDQQAVHAEARRRGVRVLGTENEQHNEGIRHVDATLGYEPHHGTWRWACTV